MNKIGMITLGAAIILGGSIGFGAINHGFAQENPSKTVESKASHELIGIEKAKAVALEQVDGIVESIELEKYNGQTYYEVDIDKDNKDFDIDVDAYTAKIIKIDESRDDDDYEVHASAATKGSLISEKEAIAIAKKNITGEVVEIELDEDDGRYEYEMELKTS
ncbi:PepSY domain-containing protein, partial [Metabacillus rhizolycopersici]